MAEEKPATPVKQGQTASESWRDFFRDQADTPIVREMRQFRAVRWILAFSLLAFAWIVDGFFDLKGWVALLIVFGLATFLEIQALTSQGRTRLEQPPQDEQEK